MELKLRIAAILSIIASVLRASDKEEMEKNLDEPVSAQESDVLIYFAGILETQLKKYAQIYSPRDLSLKEWISNFWYWGVRQEAFTKDLQQQFLGIIQLPSVEALWAEVVIMTLKDDPAFQKLFQETVITGRLATKIDWDNMKFYVPGIEAR